jgi:hypothetical protein
LDVFHTWEILFLSLIISHSSPPLPAFRAALLLSRRGTSIWQLSSALATNKEEKNNEKKRMELKRMLAMMGTEALWLRRRLILALGYQLLGGTAGGSTCFGDRRRTEKKMKIKREGNEGKLHE